MTLQTTTLNLENSHSITAKSKSNFSASFFFLSTEKRVAMERVYAFFHVVDDLVDEEQDPILRQNGLNEWREDLLRVYEGVPKAPLLKELQESIQRFKIPKEYFLKLIEGCEMDMTKSRFLDFSELYEYCYRVASMVGLVCMKIFEHESDTSEAFAINLGVALQLTNIIRDVGVDADKGRIYLPRVELERFGVREIDILNGRTTPEFFALMEFQYRRAVEYYEKSRGEFLKDKQNKLLAAKMMATVYRRILEKIRKKHYPVLKERVRLLFPEKVFILFKTFVSFK